MLTDVLEMSSPLINLVTALPSEAKPIASRLDLEPAHVNCGFPVYRRNGVALIVSGPGKVNAAAATALLHAFAGCPRDAVWVNAGIAGLSSDCGKRTLSRLKRGPVSKPDNPAWSRMRLRGH